MQRSRIFAKSRINLALKHAEDGFASLLLDWLKLSKATILSFGENAKDMLAVTNYEVLEEKLTEQAAQNPMPATAEDCSKEFLEHYFDFLVAAATLCKITLDDSLNLIVEKEADIIEAAIRHYNMITLSCKRLINPEDVTRIDNAVSDLRSTVKTYQGRATDAFYTELMLTQINRAGEGILSAIQDGFPAKLVHGYWHALEPDVAICQDDAAAYNVLSRCYRKVRNNILEAIQKAPNSDESTFAGKTAIIQFVEKRLDAVTRTANEPVTSTQVKEFKWLKTTLRNMTSITSDGMDAQENMLKAQIQRCQYIVGRI